MSISKHVTPNLEGLTNAINKKARAAINIKNVSDIIPAGDCSTCMFSSNGSCLAEWCIFKELPPMSGTRTNKCPLCGEEATASAYSGGMFTLCDKCKKKLQNATDGSCIVCGLSLNKDEIVICKKCAETIKDEVINPKEKQCMICGSNSGKKDICTTCVGKIQTKINE